MELTPQKASSVKLRDIFKRSFEVLVLSPFEWFINLGHIANGYFYDDREHRNQYYLSIHDR